MTEGETDTVLQTDSRNFEQPLEFIPERWTTRPELVKDKSVFIPFNIGRHRFPFLLSMMLRLPDADHSYFVGQGACVGKRLAMLEIRRVIGETLGRYDVVIAPDQSKEVWIDGKEDTFTTVCPPLPVIFTDRVR